MSNNTVQNLLPLTNSQVLILKTLARNPNGLTREMLLEKSGVVCDNATLGPVYQEGIEKHSESLVAYRLVKVEKRSPTDPTLFKLTAGGVQAAGSYSARKRGQTDKVPPEELDPVVLSIRALKPYGLELFTDDDLKEIREQLPEEHREVTLTSLRQQIVNRRKQGAYAKETENFPHWYVEYRESREFKVFNARVKDQFGGCAIDPTHDKEVTVIHRRFKDEQGNNILACERISDGIALCARCLKRNHKFLVLIPEVNPLEIDESEPDTEERELSQGEEFYQNQD